MASLWQDTTHSKLFFNNINIANLYPSKHAPLQPKWGQGGQTQPTQTRAECGRQYQCPRWSSRPRLSGQPDPVVWGPDMPQISHYWDWDHHDELLPVWKLDQNVIRYLQPLFLFTKDFYSFYSFIVFLNTLDAFADTTEKAFMSPP